MERELLTWSNLIVWAVCSVFLYLSLNFRLYTIFRRSGRKQKEEPLRRKAGETRRMPPRPMRKVLNP